MFVTIVEGQVHPAREADLLAAWSSTTAEPVPDGLIESSLLHADDDRWRIVSVWESRDAVMAMRAAGRPAALVMFESAGADAAVSMWTVQGRISAVAR